MTSRRFPPTSRAFTLLCATLVSLMATAAQAEELRYEAHWVEGARPSVHTAPLTLQAFLDSGEDLAAAGFVLVDAETAIRDGRRLYAGLWTTGSGATIFAGPMGPIEFSRAMRSRRDQGLRLVDFEIFRPDSGGRRYIGVWRPGSGEEILTGPMQQDAFFARGERFIADGLRLRDVEVEEIDGTLFYSGLFRSGAGLNSITPPMRRAQFLRRQAIMLEGGQELRDMERVGGGRANRFVGVWASGDDAAEITSPRSFGQQFALAQSQFNAGRRTLDFELQRIASPPGGDGGGGSVDPDAPPEMPTNQRHVGITDGNILRLQFTQIDDQPFTLELPRDALPDWLPRTDEGDPILPDAHCGLHIRRADSIFWQVPGDPEVTTPPFNAVPDVAALGDDVFLGGVHFAGPMGACTGSQKPWVFPSPFTSSGPFVPLPNMSLVVQLRQGAEIAFITDTGPEPKPLDLDKLFKDDSKKKLEEQVKFWNALLEEGEDISDYCPIIGAYWQQLCTQFPDKSEVCTAEVAALPDC